MVIVPHVTVNSYTHLTWGFISLHVDLLIFDGSPETLYEDVIIGTATMIHADPGSSIKKQSGVLRAGEVAPLIRVHDLGIGDLQCFSAGIKDKVDFHVIVHFPVEDKAGKPVNYGNQIKPVRFHRDVGNIDRPDMIRMVDFQAFQ